MTFEPCNRSRSGELVIFQVVSLDLVIMIIVLQIVFSVEVGRGCSGLHLRLADG